MWLGNDDKTIEPYPFVVDHELEAIHKDVLSLIRKQKRLPVEAGGRKKLYTIVHAPRYIKKQLVEMVGTSGR
jgi:hypothetical protein